jgi:hypothetical protein
VTAPHETPAYGRSVPPAVHQALSDTDMPPAARLMMWHLATRLDLMEFTNVKAESLALEMGIAGTTVSHMLTLLVERGYLSESGQRKPRAFRMMWSRRTGKARDA